MTRDVHCCVTVDYQQIANDNISNQIHGFTIDYGKFILNSDIYPWTYLFPEAHSFPLASLRKSVHFS